MNKGLIVIGSTGSGKTTFLNQLYKQYNEFEFVKWVNPDFYVEDRNHEFYNNPLAASRYIKNTTLPNILSENKDFIFDTTGSNIKTIKKLIDSNPNYDFTILMIWCHPLISFKRNILRERRLPRQVVLDNWYKVYSQISEYIGLVKRGNIYIYETEYSSEEIKFRDKNFYNLQNGISVLLKNNNATSSFKKESTKYTLEELQIKEEKFNNSILKIEESLKNILLQKVGLCTSKKELYNNLVQWILEIK